MEQQVDNQGPKPKPIRIGLGVALIVVAIYSLVTTLHPTPGMERANNGGELVGMLFVPFALAVCGVWLVLEGMRRRKQ